MSLARCGSDSVVQWLCPALGQVVPFKWSSGILLSTSHWWVNNISESPPPYFCEFFWRRLQRTALCWWPWQKFHPCVITYSFIGCDLFFLLKHTLWHATFRNVHMHESVCVCVFACVCEMWLTGGTLDTDYWQASWGLVAWAHHPPNKLK